VGLFPEVRRHFQVTRCNQCAAAPCTYACPTAAMHQRPDGIVDFDKSICIGCKACIAACPYDAIFINPDDGSAEKCNFCAHRLDVGLAPACVVVCPTEAILVGNLDDPASRDAQIVHRDAVAVRRPEKDTLPKLFYRGAHEATLDPLAARRPGGGLFLWSEQLRGGQHVVGGHPGAVEGAGVTSPAAGPSTSSAAALLAYDVPHRAPWDWRVSLYTVTKAVAAGAYLVPLFLILLGRLEASSPLWVWGTPLLGLAFLAITGALLIADLTHPTRFWMIFVRPQWKSWLVRGAFLIAGFGAILAMHLGAAWSGRDALLLPLAAVGAPLALATAVYTAFLFAQSKARDLWQSPLLPSHLVVETLLAGAGASLPLALALAPDAVPGLLWTLFAAVSLHLFFLLGELALPHATAHARLAAWEMFSGRYRSYSRVGALLSIVALSGPWLGASTPVAAAIVGVAALGGLFAHEHAYVQAGQSVPLA
jgi:Fe-S-cluster-containing dehydrogenase component/formate-dependent nitrite reductase membrane component NrfD